MTVRRLPYTTKLMPDHEGSIFQRARQHPYGAPLFLAWSLIAIAGTGSASLVLSGLFSQLTEGSELGKIAEAVEDNEGVIIMIGMLAQLIVQAWLVFPSIPAPILWVLVNAIVCTASAMAILTFPEGVRSNPDEERGVPIGGIIMLILFAIAGTQVFFRVRKRPWLGIVILGSALPVYWLWFRLTITTQLDERINSLLLPMSLELNGGPPVAILGVLPHSLLAGAIIAWLMPPCEERPTERRTEP